MNRTCDNSELVRNNRVVKLFYYFKMSQLNKSSIEKDITYIIEKIKALHPNNYYSIMDQYHAYRKVSETSQNLMHIRNWLIRLYTDLSTRPISEPSDSSDEPYE